MSQFTRRLAVGVVGACAALGVAAGPAAAYPTVDFNVCNPYCDPDTEQGFVDGSITWYNRTAGVTGGVESYFEDGRPTTAYFDAYAGSVKIDSDHRTAANGSRRGFNFTIGDTNLEGGINRIKITVCTLVNGDPKYCSTPMNYTRP
ncbi:hypothetical protein [Streptomyces sp. S.PB5]|uniref:hypothetical protein n=1 Tax=Streptomyces sp. S.PB5 TaxID=3020844 RepID=UPI0025B11F05|nr:hypothetical protein [Streptomyces sp. S.PB5]MDN3027434.1 hypothetical protein [Streptomyces sp. S.PB5]